MPDSKDATETEAFSFDPGRTVETPIASGVVFGETEPPLLSPGSSIGDISILSLLGRGGMGEVYKAWDGALQRNVAVKVVSDAVVNDKQFVARFEREVRAASSLTHTHIAQVYSTGRIGTKPYYVMEYVDGQSLGQVLQEQGPISGFKCLTYLMQASDGLRAAYEKGIIHRDIKPDNLMLDTKGNIKIVDFGLARLQTDDARITQTNVVMGTPNYISPEQVTGKSVDHRADIYSLGATFYHLFSGKVPFEAESAVGVMMKHVSQPLMSLKTMNNRIPQPVSNVIEKMMAKNASDRYQTYEALIRDLKLVESGQGRQTLAIGSIGEREGAEKEPNVNRMMLVAIGVLLVVVFVVAIRKSTPARAPADGTLAAEILEQLKAAGAETETVTATADGPAPTAPRSGNRTVLSPAAVAEIAARESAASTASAGTGEPAPAQSTSGVNAAPAQTALELPAPQGASVAAESVADQERRSQTVENMQRMSLVVQMFLSEGEELPPDLSSTGGAVGFKAEDQKDGWGRDIRYEQTGVRTYRFRSAGPDGTFGSADDVVTENGRLVRKP